MRLESMALYRYNYGIAKPKWGFKKETIKGYYTKSISYVLDLGKSQLVLTMEKKLKDWEREND